MLKLQIILSAGLAQKDSIKAQNKTRKAVLYRKKLQLVTYWQIEVVMKVGRFGTVIFLFLIFYETGKV